MLTGYNTDIKHEGIIYHVQTEDGGTENPFIVSLVYRGGRILASKKTSYAQILGTSDLLTRLRDLLENQHRAMIKAILTGSIATDAPKSPAAPAAGVPAPPRPPVAAGATPAPVRPAPDPGQPPTQQPPPRPPQVPQAAPGTPPPAPEGKPPLEIPQSNIGDTPADSTTEKNLDQVILEYLASEIDKE